MNIKFLLLSIIILNWSMPSQDPAKKADGNVPAVSQDAALEGSVPDLITQGKLLYRSARFKLALAKFESALKQEPENDEALGLAAETAFRLDNQAQARDYFSRRVELPKQKDSVKAFCYYKVALTYWREAHDVVAKYGQLEEGRLVYRLPEQGAAEVNTAVESGLASVDRALAVTNNFVEAYNIRNLLHTEAALAKTGDPGAKEHQRLAIEALRRAIEITEVAGEGRRVEAADFSQPTIRVSEFPRTREEEERLDDPMMKLIEGGRPIKRLTANFPNVRMLKPVSDPNDPGAKSSTGQPSEVAQATVPVPAAIKVEVLISTMGEVVFARAVEGRADLNGSAILAARGWKFEPAKFEGKPVQISGVITFEVKPKGK